jgi:hypothetical protein
MVMLQLKDDFSRLQFGEFSAPASEIATTLFGHVSKQWSPDEVEVYGDAFCYLTLGWLDVMNKTIGDPSRLERCPELIERS